MNLKKEEVDKALQTQLKQSKGKKKAPAAPATQAAAVEEPAQEAAAPQISVKKARVSPWSTSTLACLK